MAGDHTLTGLAVPQGLDELHDLLEQVGVALPVLAPEEARVLRAVARPIASRP